MEQDNIKNILSNYYWDNSKHSHYQNIPQFVKEAMEYSETIDENWRGDTARYKHILDVVNFSKNLKIGDIGANTGFFSLSLAHRFPNIEVTAYEGNPNHVRFIELIRNAFELKNLFMKNEYIDFEGISYLGNQDLLLNLNVLHHAGVDFDKDKIGSVDKLFNFAVSYLSKLKEHTKEIIFQMGYNWGGDKTKPIVNLQDDLGKIKYSAELFIQSGWKITNIALCGKRDEVISYRNLPSELIEYLNKGINDSKMEDELKNSILSVKPEMLSEFYRRPIFILKRK